MSLVDPHGGAGLRPLLIEDSALESERARAATLPSLRVSSREKGDIIMMGIGGFTPLSGFMGHADWREVCDDMRLANGLFWPIPITLSADTVEAGSLVVGSEITLCDPEDGMPLAIMRVDEKYRINKAHECAPVKLMGRVVMAPTEAPASRDVNPSRRSVENPIQFGSYILPKLILPSLPMAPSMSPRQPEW